MPENEIIAEIHHHREKVAREHDFDVDKLSAHFRSLEAGYAAKGWEFVSFAEVPEQDDSYILREQPPKPGPQSEPSSPPPSSKPARWSPANPPSTSASASSASTGCPRRETPSIVPSRHSCFVDKIASPSSGEARSP